MNGMLGALVLCLVASVSAVPPHCYEGQVAKDQFFDDSFVCKEDIPYPGELIQADLQYADLDTLYFLDTASTCYNETDYYTRSFRQSGEYAYQCVCPSPRKRIDRVYLHNDICFVVDPAKQDVQYAQCGGHCSFDYGTQIATSSRGYFCVHQSFVQRQFLVWCPALPGPTHAPAHAHGPSRVARAAGAGQMFGRFERLTQTLPSLCSCRGYFCSDHNQLIPQHGAGAAVVTGVH